MAADDIQLRFRPDDSFTIVQFTDTHFATGAGEDLRTRALMEMVLDVEHPDLVALTGDIIEGKSSPDPAAAWRYAVEPMEARGIPWAAVFGNHDDEGSLSRRQLLAVQQSCDMCLTRRGPDDIGGVGNFVLRVMAHEQAHAAQPADAPLTPPLSREYRGESARAALFFLDSGSYAPLFCGKYAWIKKKQIAWFVAEAAALPPHIPILVFFHIPLPEFNTVWNLGHCRGSRLEDVCCPRHNSGFFAVMKQAGVSGVFVGHDHINDYEGSLDGIRLCYGRGTGHGTYGQEGFARGARIIRLMRRSTDFQSWIRLDDGLRLDQ